MKTPEEVATGLVRVEVRPHGRHDVLFGNCIMIGTMDASYAEDVRGNIFRIILATITQDRRDGWAWALADPSVSEGREGEIRDRGWDVDAKRDLLALLDHARVTIAWMSHERDIQDRIDAARREGEQKGWNKAATAAEYAWSFAGGITGGVRAIGDVLRMLRSGVDEGIAKAVPEVTL